MKGCVMLVAIALFLLAAFSLGSSPALAQSTPLPPVTHPRETRMSIRARQLQQKLADDIERAKAKGADVAAAEKNKAEGDAALKAGHLRIAVRHYEAGENVLPKK